MKCKKLLMFCLTSLAELSQHTLRQEIKLGEILMKTNEVKGAVDQVLANVAEASAEILALLEELHAQNEALQNVDAETEAKLAEAIAKTRVLADIVPNVQPEPEVPEVPAPEVPAPELPAPELPAEEPVAEQPIEEVPAEQPAEPVIEVPAEIPTEGTFE